MVEDVKKEEKLKAEREQAKKKKMKSCLSSEKKLSELFSEAVLTLTRSKEQNIMSVTFSINLKELSKEY